VSPKARIKTLIMSYRGCKKYGTKKKRDKFRNKTNVKHPTINNNKVSGFKLECNIFIFNLCEF
jgi:hypothetical protein